MIVLAVAAVASRWANEPPPQSEWNVDPAPPSDLDQALDQILSRQRCVTAAEADEEIRGRLAELGLSQWKITWESGVVADGCVSAGIDTVQQVVRLSDALSPEVKDALEPVADDLIDRCVGVDEATVMLTSVLSGLGETNWEIRRTDMVGGPLDRLEEIKQHARAGCYVYSGTGMTSEGIRLFFIGGLDNETTPPPSSLESIAP